MIDISSLQGEQEALKGTRILVLKVTTITWYLLGMQVLRPHPRPIDSEILGVGPSTLTLTSPLSNFDTCTLIFENHWLEENEGLIRRREWYNFSYRHNISGYAGKQTFPLLQLEHGVWAGKGCRVRQGKIMENFYVSLLPLKKWGTIEGLI